jgi:hypothetical protein
MSGEVGRRQAHRHGFRGPRAVALRHVRSIGPWIGREHLSEEKSGVRAHAHTACSQEGDSKVPRLLCRRVGSRQELAE